MFLTTPQQESFATTGITNAVVSDDYTLLISELITVCNPNEIVKSQACKEKIDNIYEAHERTNKPIANFYKALMPYSFFLNNFIEAAILSGDKSLYDKVTNDILDNSNNNSIVPIIANRKDLAKYCFIAFSRATRDFKEKKCLDRNFIQNNFGNTCEANFLKLYRNAKYCR